MILQMGCPTLWIPECVDNPGCDNGIFDSLVDFLFDISCQVVVITDRRRRVDEILGLA